MAGNPHCEWEGNPLPASALPVPAINAGSVTVTPASGGLTRGTVVLLHGLGQTLDAWASTSQFSNLAAALQADGWQTVAIPYPADLLASPVGSQQQTGLNTDFAGDPLSPPGTRYVRRFLAEWDHVKAYLVSLNGAYWPTWCVGFSLGGWSALQLFINRQADFVGMASLCPVTQMSYVYNPISATPVAGSFAALFSGSVALDAGGDVPITALNGIKKPVWLGWGEGVEVCVINGWKTNTTAGTAGEAFDGITEVVYQSTATGGFLGGPNAPHLNAVPKLSVTHVPVLSFPWELGDGQGLTLYHASGPLSDTVVVSGDQTVATIAAQGYINVVRQALTGGPLGPSAGVVASATGTTPTTLVPFTATMPRTLLNNEQILLWHNASRNQLVTVNGDQSPSTISGAGHIVVNTYTPNTNFNSPDYVIIDSGYTTADIVIGDYGPNVGFGFAPEATVVDTNNWTGQPFLMQSAGTGPIVFGQTQFIPPAVTLARAYAGDGTVQLWTSGDTFVGWARTRKLAATASANLGAGGHVTTAAGVDDSTNPTGYVNQGHTMTAGNVTDITNWVTAKLDTLYARTY
jgi:pimeloyl-ACP methyl ester carboxylesterase